ncbi:MAG: hypothetical protein AAB276_04585, partial [Pseudomonadota bacterium]
MSRNPLSTIRFSVLIALGAVSMALIGCESLDRSNPWAIPATPATTENTTLEGTLLPDSTSASAIPIAQPIPATAKVSLLLPLTGRGAETGQAMLNAAQLAMFDLGATSLFELLPQDTGKGA